MIRALITLSLLCGTAQAEPFKYVIDPGSSTLDARTHKDGIASGLAHDHIIRAEGATGTVTYDPTAANAWSLEVSVPTAKLLVDPARIRFSHGLKSQIDADDRKEIEKSMRGSDQLATDKFKTISFKSTRIRRSGEGQYQVEGELTLRGVTKTVTVDTKMERDDKRFVGRGKLRIKHTQFGFKPYSAALGAVKNQDKIDLILKIVANRAP